MLEESLGGVAAACLLKILELRKLHNMHHMVVERILFWTRKVDTDIARKISRMWLGTVKGVSLLTSH